MFAIIGFMEWILICLVGSLYVLLPIALIAVVVWLIVRKRKQTA